MANAYLKFVSTNIVEFSQRVDDEFGDLSSAQFNWKESPKRWSIGDCLDHIITTNRAYFPQLEALTRSEYTPPLLARLHKSYHLFWASRLKPSTSAEVMARAKSPVVFAPTCSTHEPTIVKTFLGHQSAMVKLLQNLPSISHDMIIIHSAASKFITYPLRDAVEMMTSHELRHINQAIRIKELLGFPEK